MMGEILAMTLKKHCRWVRFSSLSADFFLAQQELFFFLKKQSMRQMIPWNFFFERLLSVMLLVISANSKWYEGEE
jgi:hypothetical protein